MAKTGHPNFILKFQSSWRGKSHIWSVASSHSGASFTSPADITSFMQSVWTVLSNFLASGSTTFCAGYDYYNGQDSAALVTIEFPTAAAATTAGYGSTEYGGAYTGAATGSFSGLETCVVLQAPVGLSKTGKPVYLKKYIHSVPGGNSSDTPPFQAPTAGETAAELGNGSLFGSRVLISASGKQGTWTVFPFFGAHQMPRKRKKKASTSGLTVGDLLSIGRDLSALGSAE